MQYLGPISSGTSYSFTTMKNFTRISDESLEYCPCTRHLKKFNVKCLCSRGTSFPNKSWTRFHRRSAALYVSRREVLREYYIQYKYENNAIHFIRTSTYILPLLIENCIAKFFDRFRAMMHGTIGTDISLDIVSQGDVFTILVISCNAG